jgi:hypothetical protein
MIIKPIVVIRYAKEIIIGNQIYYRCSLCNSSSLYMKGDLSGIYCKECGAEMEWSGNDY